MLLNCPSKFCVALDLSSWKMPLTSTSASVPGYPPSSEAFRVGSSPVAAISIYNKPPLTVEYLYHVAHVVGAVLQVFALLLAKAQLDDILDAPSPELHRHPHEEVL